MANNNTVEQINTYMRCTLSYEGENCVSQPDQKYRVSEKDWTSFFYLFFSRCPVCGEWCKLHWLNFWKRSNLFSDTLYVTDWGNREVPKPSKAQQQIRLRLYNSPAIPTSLWIPNHRKHRILTTDAILCFRRTWNTRTFGIKSTDMMLVGATC